MLIGAHVSIAGGLEKSIERGNQIGAECIQTFASPPRTLSFYPFSVETITKYKDAKQSSNIKLHVFHAVYLVNLANERPDYVKASIESLINYQQTASDIQALGTILHIGSHKGIGFDNVKHQVAEAINEILVSSPPDVMLLLENAAGHKGTIGQTIDELADLFDLIPSSNKLGICLDTQHSFASGVDGREESHISIFLNEINSKIGLEKVEVIHINDSKVECNSHKDRHENIGLGELGSQGISNWINHPQLKDLPFILEVPGIDGKGPGEKDLQAVRGLKKHGM